MVIKGLTEVNQKHTLRTLISLKKVDLNFISAWKKQNILVDS